MNDFKASLLREKFTLTPKNSGEEKIVALSNRLAIPLVSPDGIDNDVFIIRTQNMHSCARMAASTIKEFTEKGSLVNRARPVPWQTMWDDITKGFEKIWNDNIWICVYHNGKIIYQEGEHHPFLDIIEQCDASNLNNYSQSIKIAEDIFAQAGKKVTIEYDSNIALVTHITPTLARSGIIARAASGTTTFNYTAAPDKENPQRIHPYTSLTVAATFLEAIQLAFQIGFMSQRKEFSLFEKYSDEDKKLQRSVTRLGNLNRAIKKYEEKFIVNYRPDKPNFSALSFQAMETAIDIFKDEVQEKIENGEIENKGWVF
ncbi:MAG: hypothetical protein AAF244_02150 [Pseudomonadota bacterium]